MKSTALKKSDFTLVKKYAVLFVLLFGLGLLMFAEHFYEDAVTVDEVQTVPERLEVKSEVGYMAPDFSLPDLDGKRVSLKDLRGQVVILNLWATWCAPCRVEMPSIENLYRRFRSEGLTVLAVSLDKGADPKVREYIREHRFSFPVLIDRKEQVETLYDTFTIPTTFVIDRKGRVAAKVDGAKNWESAETFEALQVLLNMK